jgi:superoxide dismutase, Fe-Mn family
MPTKKIYQLPKLKYGYDELWPYLTEEQVRLHHQKHHRGYVNNANQLSADIESARKKNELDNVKCLTKTLAFNVGGHILHSLFWENLQPADKEKAISPSLEKKLKKNFKSIKKFKQEFEQAANSVEGSGWAALVLHPETDRLLIIQIEKHNVNLLPDHTILMVLDVWEHAYYIDYRHKRSVYVQSFWEIVNWTMVEQRLKKL